METLVNGHLQFDAPVPQRIAIVRALPGLGDLLCSVPAFRALRSAFPQAEIALIGLPWAKAFVQRFGAYLDRWIEFPGYPGIPEVPFSSQQTIDFLRQHQSAFDLALQMHGNGSIMNSFALLLGAKQTSGFYRQGQYCPELGQFLPYPEQLPEVRRHLHLLRFLGIGAQDESLEFPVAEAEQEEFEAMRQAYQLRARSYLCIHPGASTADRRWAVEHFAIVADALAAQNFQIVLTGSSAEKELTQGVAQRMRHPAIDLAGQTSLGALALLLQQAKLLICNDTGVSHLGAAMETQSVVIFSQSEPHRWAPINRDRHRIVAMPSVETAHLYPAATPMQVLREALALLHDQEVSYAS